MVMAPVAVRRHPRVGMPLLHVAHPSGASCSRPAPRMSCNLTFNFHELFSLGLKKQKALTVRRPPAKLRLSCAACACRHDCARASRKSAPKQGAKLVLHLEFAVEAVKNRCDTAAACLCHSPLSRRHSASAAAGGRWPPCASRRERISFRARACVRSVR